MNKWSQKNTFRRQNPSNSHSIPQRRTATSRLNRRPRCIGSCSVVPVHLQQLRMSHEHPRGQASGFCHLFQRHDPHWKTADPTALSNSRLVLMLPHAPLYWPPVAPSQSLSSKTVQNGRTWEWSLMACAMNGCSTCILTFFVKMDDDNRFSWTLFWSGMFGNRLLLLANVLHKSPPDIASF